MLYTPYLYCHFVIPLSRYGNQYTPDTQPYKYNRLDRYMYVFRRSLELAPFQGWFVESGMLFITPLGKVIENLTYVYISAWVDVRGLVPYRDTSNRVIVRVSVYFRIRVQRHIF